MHVGLCLTSMCFRVIVFVDVIVFIVVVFAVIVVVAVVFVVIDSVYVTYLLCHCL